MYNCEFKWNFLLGTCTGQEVPPKPPQKESRSKAVMETLFQKHGSSAFFTLV